MIKQLSWRVIAIALVVNAAPIISFAQTNEIRFAKACDQGKSYLITAVGDILPHQVIQEYAYEKKSFRPLWSALEPYLKISDVSYANLETPVADRTNYFGRKVKLSGLRFDTNEFAYKNSNHVYTSFPQFNVHPLLLKSLRASGFDVVSTANNHSLDRRSRGIDRTIYWLKQNKIKFTGTYDSEQKRSERSLYTITKKNGLTIAWIACTAFTNRGLLDRNKQVVYCYQSQSEIKRAIKKLAQRSDIDAVIVTPHWGKEYKVKPNQKQQAFAKMVLDAGATAVIGSHPHVLQPWEKYVTKDRRETFIIYSLGNFISNQRKTPTRSTIALMLVLGKAKRGKAFVRGVRYLPMMMESNDKKQDMGLRILNQKAELTKSEQESLDYINAYFPKTMSYHPNQGRITAVCK